MAEEFANKIKRLELENFTCFGKVAMDFSPGINVFIGENGTGKTHLLKTLLMSTNTSLLERYTQLPKANDGSYHLLAPAIAKAFLSNYYPSSVRSINLLKIGTPRDESGIIKFRGFGNEDYLGLQIDTVRNEWDGTFQMEHRGIFIPPQEILSWFKGFISSYEHRESSIDPTYYFLAKALSLYKLRGDSLLKAKEISEELAESIGAEVQLEGDEFFVYYKNGKGIRATLEATGINKISQILHLVLNGSISDKTILIWDEPEVNLNPKLIKDTCNFIVKLAGMGCQIFLATHDYLLPYHLSLSVEYADVMKKMEQPVPSMKFFSLYKGEDGTQVEEGDDMPSIHHDAIMEGHAFHNEFEKELFRKSLNQGA